MSFTLSPSFLVVSWLTLITVILLAVGALKLISYLKTRGQPAETAGFLSWFLADNGGDAQIASIAELILGKPVSGKRFAIFTLITLATGSILASSLSHSRRVAHLKRQVERANTATKESGKLSPDLQVLLTAVANLAESVSSLKLGATSNTPTERTTRISRSSQTSGSTAPKSNHNGQRDIADYAQTQEDATY